MWPKHHPVRTVPLAKVSLTSVNASWNILPLNCNPLYCEHLSRAQSAFAELALQNAVLYAHGHTHSPQLLPHLYKTRSSSNQHLNINQWCRCFLKWSILFRFVQIQNWPLLLWAQIHLTQKNSPQDRANAPSVALSMFWACKLAPTLSWQTMLTGPNAWHNTCWHCCLNVTQCFPE